MNYSQHLLISILCLNLFSAAHADNKKIRIGLRAHSGVEAGLKQWQATADYLSEQLGTKVSLKPYTKLDALMSAAGENKFDFVITNPSSYVEMNLRYKTKSLLTLNNKRSNTAQTRFGSVIFTYAENIDVTRLTDLKNKTVMGVSEPAFGGWRVAWLELKQQGIDPYSDLNRLDWGGGNQHNVVYAVRDKKVDAGVVRTDMLERMAAQKLIDLREFRILNPKETQDFPFFHTTPLYPEWPFAAMPSAPVELQEKIKQALLKLSEDHPAAAAGQYIGWVDSLSYEPVRQLMQELSVGPYKKPEQTRVTTSRWVLIVLFILLALFVSRKKYKIKQH